MAIGDLASPADLVASVRLLGRFRRDNPWLESAALVDVDTHDGVLAYTVRGPDRAIRVHLDPGADPAAVPDGRPLLAGAPAGPTDIAPHSWQVRRT